MNESLEPTPNPIEKVEAKLLLEAIYQVYGYDFRQYSFPSVTRRMLHRMQALGLHSISALQERVLRDAQVWNSLFNDICIPVTEMYRDPSFYESIRHKLIPELRKLDRIRIWHAGCSTGEEAYSLAILLTEENLYNRSSIYATDLNENWLAQAKLGRYSLDRMQHYTRNYILSGGYQPFSNYYTVSDRYAVMEAELRRNITFARHNLTCDESFNEFQLIVCRNVLIYFNQELQHNVIQLFRKSLSPGGFLALGSREAISQSREASGWQAFDSKHRIYQYLEVEGD